MIDNLCRKLTQKMLDREIIDFEDWEVYMYGLQMLIFGVVKLIGFMLLAWVTGWTLEALVFITAFSLLRVNAGGYHADTYFKCFAITSCFSFLSIWVVKSGFIGASIVYTAVILTAAAILILLYAPVDTPNKRMVGKERSIFRRRSLAAMLMEMSAIVIVYCINPEIINFCNIAAMAMLFEGITLTPLIAANNIQKERGYYNEE